MDTREGDERAVMAVTVAQHAIAAGLLWSRYQARPHQHHEMKTPERGRTKVTESDGSLRRL
jgi:hypothetical protein